MRLLQNRFILGAASFLIIGTGTIFVLQPTVAHADAFVRIQPDKQTGDIAIFGSVSLTSGQPESEVYVAVSDPNNPGMGSNNTSNNNNNSANDNSTNQENSNSSNDPT